VHSLHPVKNADVSDLNVHTEAQVHFVGFLHDVRNMISTGIAYLYSLSISRVFRAAYDKPFLLPYHSACPGNISQTLELNEGTHGSYVHVLACVVYSTT